jgi:cellulose biosynthesis protein BcsQ
MKKEPTFIAFSTQKGGAGKTTLTVLMASYLYYVRGYDVVVVDCDFPQFSIKDMRERDMQNIESNEYLLRQTHEMMRRTGKPAYPIVESRPDEAVETVKPFLEMDTPPDFIFFDLAGTIDNLGVIETIATMDYIFCPITADNVVLRSSIMFASQLNDMFISVGKTNIKELNMLWNMVDARDLQVFTEIKTNTTLLGNNAKRDQGACGQNPKRAEIGKNRIQRGNKRKHRTVLLCGRGLGEI